MDGEQKVPSTLKLTYHISEKDYVSFNQLFFEKDVKKRTNKAYIMSSIIILISIVLGVQVVISGRYKEYLLDALIIFTFCMGIYNIFLNKKIIPNSIIKNSKKIYRSTRFYNNEITLEVCDGYLVELSSEGRVKLFFEDIENVLENQQLLVLLFKNKHTLIINKAVIDNKLLRQIPQMAKK